MNKRTGIITTALSILSSVVALSLDNSSMAATSNSTYSVSCSPANDGSAILKYFTNGNLNWQTSIPLKITNVQVSNLLDPPKAELDKLKSSVFAVNNTWPILARPGSAFTLKMNVYPPGNWNSNVSISYSITAPNGYINPVTNSAVLTQQWETTAINLGNHIYAVGESIPAQFPDGSVINATVSASDSCGETSINIPDIATVTDKPIWNLIRLVK